MKLVKVYPSGGKLPYIILLDGNAELELDPLAFRYHKVAEHNLGLPLEPGKPVVSSGNVYVLLEPDGRPTCELERVPPVFFSPFCRMGEDQRVGALQFQGCLEDLVRALPCAKDWVRPRGEDLPPEILVPFIAGVLKPLQAKDYLLQHTETIFSVLNRYTFHKFYTPAT